MSSSWSENSSLATGVNNKQSIKRLEIQINNFNVAIPHHIDLLRRHKKNIHKYEEEGSYDQLRKENLNVSRSVKQLKELLYQLDTLRSQVKDSDLQEFDKLTSKARLSIVTTSEQYLKLQLNVQEPAIAAYEEDNQAADELQQEYNDLARREACLTAWDSLQKDIKELHELFVSFDKIVQEDKETVQNIQDNIEETEVNVIQGCQDLKIAARYKAAIYPLTGAIVGTCLAGPIGLLAGLKIAGLSAIAGGFLGFTGGSFLKKKRNHES